MQSFVTKETHEAGSQSSICFLREVQIKQEAVNDEIRGKINS
jgi:hypothetical protein